MNSSVPDGAQSRYRRVYGGALPLLGGALLVTALVSAYFGAVPVSLSDIWHALGKWTDLEEGSYTLPENVFMGIRLPRVLMGILAGASLAAAGVLVQGLFRNPIVEPGLIGTSSGAALGAAVFFVLQAALQLPGSTWLLPISALLGALASSVVVFSLAGMGRTNVTTLLLIGIAVNAVCLGGVGFLSYLARDPQARSITFWNLGTLSGASWPSVTVVAAFVVPGLLLAWQHAGALNALLLGEESATALGLNVRAEQLRLAGLHLLLVASVTAFVGVISFVGLIAPHLLRLWRGADHRFLLPASCLLGGILVLLADLVARLSLAPAEVPIGIVTALVGAPVFVALLRRHPQLVQPQ